MVTKMTSKNQVTIPKRVLEHAGLSGLPDQERYFDVGVKGNVIMLRPVKIVLEEAIPAKQWQKFEKWAAKAHRGDKVFDSAETATGFLKKRMKQK